MLVGMNQRDVGLRPSLVGRIPKAIAHNTEDRTNKKREIRTGMFQAFPQWGHFALTCSRLLPQCAHGTTLPCGLAKR